MTAFAFILGVVPLMKASGAGAGAQNVMGTGVFWGMLIATGLGVTLDGELHAVNAQKADGSLEASLRAAGPAPAPLLSALGQPALAAGLRDLTAELKLTGSPSALVLGPLTANAR